MQEGHVPVVDPVLKTFGKMFYVKRSRLAQIAKLANNRWLPRRSLSSEALAMAKPDSTPRRRDINAGSDATATQDKFPKSIIPRTFDFGFATGLSYKDAPVSR